MSAKDQETGRGRKPRSYYVDYTKGNSRFKDRRRDNNASENTRYKSTPELAFGNRGFFITSVDEVKSYLEMRGVLEEYFENLYIKSNDNQDHNDKRETTEDEIDSELKQLRKNRPFKQMKTFSRNSIFLNIVKEFEFVDPVLIVGKFFDDLVETREIRSSNTFKVLPVLDTFRNSPACARESISNLLSQDPYKDINEAKNYFIEFQSRGNYKLHPDDKQKMIEGVAATISEVKPEWKVDREHVDYMIVLVALKSVCCVSIVENYFKRCKYNVMELCKELGIQTQDGDKNNLTEGSKSSGDDPQESDQPGNAE